MSGPEKPKRAAALRYDRGLDQAPKVVAAGAGVIADRILALAKEAGIPVREDPALAEALARLQLDQAIPEDLYAAAAEALIWAYALDARTRG